ncbi:MAG: hypothetical protein LBE76_06205 [Nitrososphaerota archaeon]|nr:hypothetical protein [Nitrososphaerota archaeon]
MKGVLRKFQARSEEVLLDAVVKALDCVTPTLAAVWFKYCNYTFNIQLTKS